MIRVPFVLCLIGYLGDSRFLCFCLAKLGNKVSWVAKLAGSTRKCFAALVAKLVKMFPPWLNWETYVSEAKFASVKQKCF